MDKHILTFNDLILEDLDPNAEQLRDLNLLPKRPWYERERDFKRGFEKDGDITDAIAAFDEAVTKYIDKHFSKQEQRSSEFTDFIWRLRNAAQSAEDPININDATWIDWWVTH